MTKPQPELFQMRYSLFPEMARWALDYKGVPHIRQSVLPGPHAPKIKKLAGQTCMPVLRHNGEVIKNSDNVLDYIEEQWPNKPLYPTDPQAREQAIAIRDRFRKWAPHFRRAYFAALLKDRAYAADVFSVGFSDKARSKYRRFFWAVTPLMRMSMKIKAEQVAESEQVVEEALTWLADNINDAGYLVGEEFSVADLAAATVVCLASLSSQTNAAIPMPLNPALQKWVERWQAYPAIAWANEMYRQYRPTSAATEDLEF